MSKVPCFSFDKFFRVWQRMNASAYFGFIQGHEWLSAQQLARIKNIIVKNQDEEIIRQYEERFTSLIGKGYGKSFLAGRMAFYSLLKTLNIGPGDEVILPAFTCAVMPNAVWRCGATPIFADIDPDNFGSEPLGIKRKITPRTRMIVAQHSFGIPCRIEDIVKIAQEHSVFLLEDSALALDSSRDGVKVGNWGDAAIFSTDHTKPLNTMLGGFFYTRNRDLFERIQESAKNMPSLAHEQQIRLYEQFLFERKYYSPKSYGRCIGISKGRSLVHQLKKQGSVFLESDYCRYVPSGHDYPYPACMPAFLAQLGLFELDRWEKVKEQRQETLRQYIQLAMDIGLKECIPAAYQDNRNDIVPLRFSFSTTQATALKKVLRQFMDIDQFWFQSAVICCPDGPASLGYHPESCPNAQKISHDIINWPCVLSDHSREIFVGLLNNITQRDGLSRGRV